jgi:hypothetical protein
VGPEFEPQRGHHETPFSYARMAFFIMERAISTTYKVFLKELTLKTFIDDVTATKAKLLLIAVESFFTENVISPH